VPMVKLRALRFFHFYFYFYFGTAGESEWLFASRCLQRAPARWGMDLLCRRRRLLPRSRVGL
jgi:hypothetical protein